MLLTRRLSSFAKILTPCPLRGRVHACDSNFRSPPPSATGMLPSKVSTCVSKLSMAACVNAVTRTRKGLPARRCATASRRMVAAQKYVLPAPGGPHTSCSGIQHTPWKQSFCDAVIGSSSRKFVPALLPPLASRSMLTSSGNFTLSESPAHADKLSWSKKARSTGLSSPVTLSRFLMCSSNLLVTVLE